MYKLQRTKRLKEEIALCDEAGNTVRTIQVDFDVDQLGKAFNERWNSIIMAEQTIKKATSDGTQTNLIEAYTAYGNAVVNMVRLVFGDENAEVIFDHYEHRPTEIATEVFPFLIQVVFPRVTAAAKEKADRLRENYGTSRGILPFRK
ncbi:MAG: hypothetical protein QM270_07080 [Bacillota bacterium]|nr:hypothetical protein [Bacillota bacterium]